MLIKNKGLAKRVLSIFIAVCLTITLMNGMSIKPAAKSFITDDAASGYNANVYKDPTTGEQFFIFDSGTENVGSGLVVVKLGFFCTAYDVSGETTGTPVTITQGGVTKTIKGSEIGTVFLYQTDDDSDTSNNTRTNIVSGQGFYDKEKNLTRIPLEYVDEKFKYEYGATSGEYKKYKTVEAHGDLVYVLDTVLTVGYKSSGNITPCIRLNERDGDTSNSGFKLTKDIMISELNDFYNALNYSSENGVFDSHQEISQYGPFIGDSGWNNEYNKNQNRYIMVCSDGFSVMNSNDDFFNNCWKGRQAVLYVSSDFVMTNTSSEATTVFNKYPAAIRCGVIPTFSQKLYAKFPRLNPYYKNQTSASVVSAFFGSATAQPRIVNGFFAVGIGSGVFLPADIQALTPTFHKVGSFAEITSPKEGEPFMVKYRFRNNGTTDASCLIRGNLVTDIAIPEGALSEQEVFMRAGEEYTVNVGPIVIDNSSFRDSGDEYWFYRDGTKEAYNALFEVAATGSISLLDTNSIDISSTDNVATNQYAIHIKAPSVTNDNITYNGYPEISTKMYSGQPIKPKIRFKNNSTFSGLFAESIQMLFGGNLISDYNYFNNKSEYITPYNDWIYTFSNYYRPKFTDASSTGTLTIRSSVYEQSAYEYWGTRGWDQSTHVGSDTKEITVYPADLEALGLRFLVVEQIDGYDTIVERDELCVGQMAFAELFVANNSDVPVFVKFTLSADKNYSQTLTLPAKTITNIRSDGFVVGSKNTTSTISGAIYMADLWEDASYEYNQDNNTVTRTVPVITPFKPQAAGGLTQDSVSYRRGTDVFTSFYIENTSFYDVHTPMPTASITVYGDSALTDIIYEEDVPFCVPAKETTMAWVKWTVPHDCPDTVYIKIICDKDNAHSGAGFTDNGENSKSLLVTANVAMPIDVSTPDTTFVKEAPYWYKSATDFSVSQNSSLMADADDFISSLSWDYWKYENEEFTKISQSAYVTPTFASIEPVGCASAFLDDADKWNMKSGYGFGLSANVDIVGADSTDILGADKTTGVQSAYCVFPEFAYRTASTSIADKYGNYIGHYIDNNTAPTGFDSIRDSSGHLLYPKCGGVYGTFSSLDINGNKLAFKMNDSTDAPVHFTPIWYPDKEYKVYIYISDVWTPGGMLSRYVESNAINIEGNMYDDYYVMEH